MGTGNTNESCRQFPTQALDERHQAFETTPHYNSTQRFFFPFFRYRSDTASSTLMRKSRWTQCFQYWGKICRNPPLQMLKLCRRQRGKRPRTAKKVGMSCRRRQPGKTSHSELRRFAHEDQQYSTVRGNAKAFYHCKHEAALIPSSVVQGCGCNSERAEKLLFGAT